MNRQKLVGIKKNHGSENECESERFEILYIYIEGIFISNRIPK